MKKIVESLLQEVRKIDEGTRHPGVVRRAFLKFSFSLIVGTSFFWKKLAQAAGYYNLGAFIKPSPSSTGTVGGPDDWTGGGPGESGVVGAANVFTPGYMYVWGQNTGGSLGLGTTGIVSSPALINNSTTWSMINWGRNNRFGTALDVSGNLLTWGTPTFGVLGTGDMAHRSSPGITGTSTWAWVSAGNNCVFGITTDGQLWSWGGNTYGQLGLGIDDTVHRSSPTLISASNWIRVFANTLSPNAFGITTDGKLWSWGRTDPDGTLGNGLAAATGNRSSPQMISTSYWKRISVENMTAIGMTTNGELWSWGANSWGQLGIGSLASQSSPQFISSSKWKNFQKGRDAVVGILTDGSVWSWGCASHGQLGQSNLTHYSVPMKLGTSTWKAVAMSDKQAIAILTTGELHAWGDGANVGGYLGLGSSYGNQSAPVRIQAAAWATTWVRIYMNVYNAAGIRNQ